MTGRSWSGRRRSWSERGSRLPLPPGKRLGRWMRSAGVAGSRLGWARSRLAWCGPIRGRRRNSGTCSGPIRGSRGCSCLWPVSSEWRRLVFSTVGGGGHRPGVPTPNRWPSTRSRCCWPACATSLSGPARAPGEARRADPIRPACHRLGRRGITIALLRLLEPFPNRRQARPCFPDAWHLPAVKSHAGHGHREAGELRISQLSARMTLTPCPADSKKKLQDFTDPNASYHHMYFLSDIFLIAICAFPCSPVRTDKLRIAWSARDGLQRGHVIPGGQVRRRSGWRLALGRVRGSQCPFGERPPDTPDHHPRALAACGNAVSQDRSAK